MRKLFMSVMALLLAFSLPAADSKAQHASSPADKVVARVMGRSISLKQLDSPSSEMSVPPDGKLTEEQRRIERELRLSAVIWEALRQDFYRQNHIVATPAEMNAFARAVLKERTARGTTRMIAEAAVKQWKLDRALYKQYGGTVIFQQSNPFEPVGAYRKFLEEKERAGVFEILDPALKQSFWEYYTGEQEMVVPPAEVNYDKPWWLQKPQG